mmetsp:Transcript_77573/g.116622  ORF Transcript_77573/g.116622 Transcript_77573/m.116622 type:complete len:207 (-) Transcript_77573:554-1174(-)
MVRRFVQKETLRLQKQRTRQGDAHPPTSTKLTRLHTLHCLGKAQTMQNRRRPRLGGRRIQLIQPIVHTLQLRLNAQLLFFVRIGNRLVQRRRLPLQQRNLIATLQHGLQRGNIIPRRIFTIQKVNIQRIRNRYRPRRDRLHHRRLARSVGADETVSISVIDDDLRIFNERFPVKGHRDTTDVDIASIRVQLSLFGFVRDGNVLLGQ